MLGRMPSVPDGFDWDLTEPGSRFSPRPAFAIGAPEEEWPTGGDAQRGAEDLIRRRIGNWAFAEQEELGIAQAVEGSVGRGAAGWAAVLEFVGLHAAGGVISVAAGMAFKHFFQRVRGALGGTERPHVNVSRGAAAYLAVGEVAERFGQGDPVEIEAVEEPSSIAGQDVSELSYVGLEPWVVLLRDRARLVRYVVVVAATGDILGSMKTPMDEWEHMYLPPPEESGWAQAPPTRRRWFRRR